MRGKIQVISSAQPSRAAGIFVASDYEIILPVLLHTSPYLLPAVAGPINIVFGNPRQDCAGHGICMLEFRSPVVRPARGCRRPVPVGLRYNATTGLLRLKVRRVELPANIYTRQFGGKHFVVESPYRLPRQVCARLGAAHDLCILPGKYRLVRGEKTLTAFLYPQALGTAPAAAVATNNVPA